MSIVHLKECNVCGEADDLLIHDMRQDTFWVNCEMCGNMGMQSDSPESAIYYWNERNNDEDFIYE